jgi:hypothetical protein
MVVPHTEHRHFTNSLSAILFELTRVTAQKQVTSCTCPAARPLLLVL